MAYNINLIYKKNNNKIKKLKILIHFIIDPNQLIKYRISNNNHSLLIKLIMILYNNSNNKCIIIIFCPKLFNLKVKIYNH